VLQEMRDYSIALKPAPHIARCGGSADRVEAKSVIPMDLSLCIFSSASGSVIMRASLTRVPAQLLFNCDIY
jgi:hypothetical protein